MGFAIAAGVAAVAGGAASYFGSQNAANSAATAASDQLDQANRNRGQALGYAGATPQELNILGQQYTAANQSLQQQQQLMNSIDPALMEASKQALQIMQGGSSASTQPMFALRNSQRAQLVNSLQAQYGPGAESTSIGQRALQQFDMQTQNMQTGQLGNLMQMGSMGAQANQGVMQSIGALGQVSQGYGNIQTRLTNASLGTGTQLYNSAGAGAVAGTLQGQGLASLGNNVMSGVGSLAGSYYGGQGNKSARPGGGGGGYDPSIGNPASTMQGTQEAGSGSFWGSSPYATAPTP